MFFLHCLVDWTAGWYRAHGPDSSSHLSLKSASPKRPSTFFLAAQSAPELPTKRESAGARGLCSSALLSYRAVRCLQGLQRKAACRIGVAAVRVAGRGLEERARRLCQFVPSPLRPDAALRGKCACA
ncbi:unnamed protein product [Prorocentrum cordatum]|uniref:Uncharacterized protein n=1 Tax=Prorocentrum cordatum TaxID=2364126 RepID=A0ABN9RG01_9DINO|nr:unnamed protein product [Polarella glacialis]